MSPLSLLLCCMLSLAAAFTSPAAALPLSRVAARSVAPVCMATSKATRVNERNRAYNKKYKSEMRTTIKRVMEAVDSEDYSVAFPTLSKAMSIIDKNVKRGIIHKNTAARRKSLLTLKVKALEPAGAAAAPAPAAAAEPEAQ